MTDRLQLLVGGAHDLPERQRTLRGTIAWSHDLLTEAERALFRRLAVFVGGFTSSSAQAVADPTGLHGLDQPLSMEILSGIASLVDKSLLQREDQIDGEVRFRMLETVREYALEQLVASGEMNDIQRRHALHFLALSEAGRIGVFIGPGSGAWLRRLDREHDNLRAALRWADDHGEVEIALRLPGTLGRYWMLRGYLNEGSAWLERVLASNAVQGATENRSLRAARALAHNAAGVLARVRGDYPTAFKHYTRCLEIRRSLEDRWGIADILTNLGALSIARGEYARARGLLAKGETLWRELGDRWGIALVLANQAILAEHEGEFVAVATLWNESLAHFSAIESLTGIGAAREHLGRLASYTGEYAVARAHLTMSLEICRSLKMEACGLNTSVASTLFALAMLDIRQRDFPQARHRLRQSTVTCQYLGKRTDLANLLEGFAALAVARGQPERAASLAGAAATLRQSIGARPSPIDQAEPLRWLEMARQDLSADAWAAAWAAGEAMALEQAVEYALDEMDTIGEDGP
jgi:tetratricopeptide (TPR) repeat protein